MSQNSKECTGIGIAHSFRQTKTSLLVYTARECFPSRVDSRKMRPRFRCKLDEMLRCAEAPMDGRSSLSMCVNTLYVTGETFYHLVEHAYSPVKRTNTDTLIVTMYTP